VAICKQWNIRLLPRDDLAPLQSPIPSLLLSGDFDPITPPEYAATVLPGLPDGQHVVFPRGTHGQAFKSGCANGLIQTFLDDPTATLDAACANQTVPRFLTEADIITVPALRAALANRGLGGLTAFAVQAAPGLLGAFFLLTALPVYLT